MLSGELCFSSSSAGGMLVPNNPALLSGMLAPIPVPVPVPAPLGAADRQGPRLLPDPEASGEPALADTSPGTAEGAAAGCAPRGDG